MSVAVGWALGHSTHLLHPLVTDREVVIPERQSVINRSRVSFAVCVAVLVWTVAAQPYA